MVSLLVGKENTVGSIVSWAKIFNISGDEEQTITFPLFQCSEKDALFRMFSVVKSRIGDLNISNFGSPTIHQCASADNFTVTRGSSLMTSGWIKTLAAQNNRF